MGSVDGYENDRLRGFAKKSYQEVKRVKFLFHTRLSFAVDESSVRQNTAGLPRKHEKRKMTHFLSLKVCPNDGKS